MRRFPVMATCVIISLLSSCGYQFQGSHNPLKDLGINKIYVRQFGNSTYRPGIEQLFSTAMIREIQKSRSFQLVSSESEADVVLSGVVTAADSSITSSRSVSIKDSVGADKGTNVASEYSASVFCLVTLVDRTGRQIFSQLASGSKIYPGSTEIGDKGATVSLVNESEQRLAIQLVASQMMAGVYQRMIDTF